MPEIKEILKVYFQFSSCTEAKLNSLTFEHSCGRFQADVLPFLLNLFTSDSGYLKELTWGLNRYINFIQRQYLQILISQRLANPNTEINFPACPTEYGNKLPNRSYLEKCHNFLRHIDNGTDFKIPSPVGGDLCKLNADKIAEKIIVDQQALCTAHDALMKVDHTYGSKNLICSIGQIIAEMKAFLSHFACAAWQDDGTVSGQSAALQNQNRALNHLERGILDFCKNIIATIFQQEFVRNNPPKDHQKIVYNFLRIRENEHNNIGATLAEPRYTPFLDFALELVKKFATISKKD